MLTKNQAESVSEALLAPDLEAQQKARAEFSAKNEIAKRQRKLTGKYGVIGMFLATIVAYFVTGSTMPWALGGLGLGLAVGRFASRRAL